MTTFERLVDQTLRRVQLNPDEAVDIKNEIIRLHKEYGGYMEHGRGAIPPADFSPRMPRPVPKPSQTKKTRGKKTMEVIDDE